SHGVLDAFNSAGAGIPFLWPYPHRFGPYGPVHYPDLALELPDPRHSLGVRDELLYVWPPTFLLIGLASAYRLLRRRGRPPAPAWVRRRSPTQRGGPRRCRRPRSGGRRRTGGAAGRRRRRRRGPASPAAPEAGG